MTWASGSFMGQVICSVQYKCRTSVVELTYMCPASYKSAGNFFSATIPSLLKILRQCGVLGVQYWLCPVQQDLVCWKSSGSVAFWACSIGSVQSNKTWSAGNPQAMWRFGHAVLALSSPTRPGLLEILRQCGVLDMYSIGSVQPNKTWSAGNPQAMWHFGHAVLALSSPTRPGLLEILRQCGVLDMYSIGSVQHNKTWSAGNPRAMWHFGHAVLALSSPTRPGLHAGNPQAMWCFGHVQYWLCPVQQDLVCWKCSGNVVC